MLLVALLENGLLKRKRGDVIFMSTARGTEAAAKLFPDAAGARCIWSATATACTGS
ncbi:MAG: hypothetical protein OXC26_23750 [Albidovulum sp.]|nr:hypothetical protein [Albidovulum sp.]